MQRQETTEGSPPPAEKAQRSSAQPPTGLISSTREFAKATRATDIQERTTIQISHSTKGDLDRIKREAGVKTYDETIRFLLEERRRLRPSTFGLLAGAGPFVRDEEEDPHRIRS
jgi:hypothetical protein